MRANECVEQTSRAALGALNVIIDQANLIRIRAAVALHGERFAAPDQLRAALAEVLPPPQRVFGRLAVGRAVPALHRMDAPAIADDEVADINRRRERTVLIGGEDAIVTGDFRRQDRAQVRTKVANRLEMPDLREGKLVRHGEAMYTARSGALPWS